MTTRHLLTMCFGLTLLTALTGCDAQDEIPSYQLTARVGAELNIDLTEHMAHNVNEQQLQVLDSRGLVCDVKLEQAPEAAIVDDLQIIWTPEEGDEGYHLFSVFLSAGCSSSGAQRVEYEVEVSNVAGSAQGDGSTDGGPVVHDLEGGKEP